MRLRVFLGDRAVGTLEFVRALGRFSFTYTDAWVAALDSFPLCPSLPIERPVDETAEVHSARARHFFENLLPEGRALDDAAAIHKVSKSNSFALLQYLGRECIGALRILDAAEDPVREEGRVRLLGHDELSQRIRERPYLPFTVWDEQVRLSLPGYQDKLAVYREGADWYLVDGVRQASTHILKPERHAGPLEGMTYNEFACLRLAGRLGLPAAEVHLQHVPEPVLEVQRFDRRWIAPGEVERIHVLDGCQALGLPAGMKYERPGGRNVEGIRDGASLPRLFAVVAAHSVNPVADAIALLRWAIFQVLVNNTDAHAKNLSFFCGASGLRLAPAYDLLCCGAFTQPLDDSYAMAIGDAFVPAQVSAFEWASLGHACGLPSRLVSVEVGRLSRRVLEHLDAVLAETTALGAPNRMLGRLREIVGAEAERHASLAEGIRGVNPALL